MTEAEKKAPDLEWLALLQELANRRTGSDDLKPLLDGLGAVTYSGPNDVHVEPPDGPLAAIAVHRSAYRPTLVYSFHPRPSNPIRVDDLRPLLEAGGELPRMPDAIGERVVVLEPASDLGLPEGTRVTGTIDHAGELLQVAIEVPAGT